MQWIVAEQASKLCVDGRVCFSVSLEVSLAGLPQWTCSDGEIIDHIYWALKVSLSPFSRSLSLAPFSGVQLSKV